MTKPLCLMSNKLFYLVWQEHNYIVPKCITRWADKYPDYVFEWCNIFRLPFDVVRCTKLQTLQYKILHRIFPCNYWVSKWESNTLEDCIHCQGIDHLSHYFYNCASIRSFWDSFTSWWLINMEEHLELVETDILFGFFGASRWTKALNFCMLHAKSFIVETTSQKNKPSFYTFLVKLKSSVNLERCICKRNDAFSSFSKDFGHLSVALG